MRHSSSDETKKTLRELFDRLIRGEAREVKSELERRADYREYFRYDHASIIGTEPSHPTTVLPGISPAVRPKRLITSPSLHPCLGLYRTQSMNKRPTCGLLLLDEAFSKMDEGRIAATLAFARDLKLQLVLATPQGKSRPGGPASGHVPLCSQGSDSGQPTVLSFTKEELREYLQGESGGADAAAS